jgi:acetyl esterase/lipase
MGRLPERCGAMRGVARRRASRTIPAVALGLAMLAPSGTALAQDMGTEMKSLLPMMSYAVAPNVIYRKVDGWTGRLDIFAPRGARAPTPVLIYYHGGGWRAGSKEERMPLLLPYMAKGWTVVNVEYRLADAAKAPAAVEDARCALRWLVRHARQPIQTSSGPVALDIDLDRVILSGTSAGAHLAMMVAIAPVSAGFDESCPDEAPVAGGAGELKVAAVIDWFGISDVANLYAVPESRAMAEGWIGGAPGTAQRAKAMSPIHYVRPGLPPMIAIHGEADPGVPFAQKVAFHEAMVAQGNVHELIGIAGGGHGIFPQDATLAAYDRIWAFLGEQHVIEQAGDR